MVFETWKGTQYETIHEASLTSYQRLNHFLDVCYGSK